ncbi:uncharacterized protein BDZ83DRAFT_643958 [Colletotrichum acutatum]|uniref:Uncharacterized protein n=1 Tax=Glomerella acutata TaxID=27357 RepID=A0AAD8U9F7_GLOAC|nr:uncharacterized protein BDZ83DRAFT_643958 [Colletotrichum acutatum]KAK1705925.1 hypothetical protein BDZ83DRAFT_643958 [Colletotrichum acutatum]
MCRAEAEVREGKQGDAEARDESMFRDPSRTTMKLVDASADTCSFVLVEDKMVRSILYGEAGGGDG